MKRAGNWNEGLEMVSVQSKFVPIFLDETWSGGFFPLVSIVLIKGFLVANKLLEIFHEDN